MPAHLGSRTNSLITQPYHNFKDIKEDMKNHCTLQYKDYMKILRGFVKIHKTSEKHIDYSVNTKNTKTVETVKKNKKYISKIIRALEYCS